MMLHDRQGPTRRTLARYASGLNKSLGSMTGQTTYPFILGGLATGLASTCTHPLDLAKVRMQTAYGNVGLVKTLRLVVQDRGPLGLFDGLSAAWFRGLTYSMARFEAFAFSKRRIEASQSVRSPIITSFLAGASAGIMSGFVANPGDVVLIRMQADRQKPVADRFCYRNIFVGLYRIASTEGPRQLFRGLNTTLFRAVLTNVGQLTSYDLLKESLLQSKILSDGPWCHFVASAGAGTIATTISQPADVVRSRLMAINGSNVSPIFLAREIIQKEGWRHLWKGWLPAFYRQTPQTILTFLFLEQLRSMVDRYREAQV